MMRPMHVAFGVRRLIAAFFRRAIELARSKAAINRRSPKVWTILGLFVLMAMVIQSLRILPKPDFASFHVCDDDSVLLQAVDRFQRGLGLTERHDRNMPDLAEPSYAYPRGQAPGAMLVMAAQVRLGASRLAAYKTSWLAATALGVLGWMLLGARWLGPAGLAAFGVYLGLFHPAGYVKLQDVCLFAVVPYYLILLCRNLARPRLATTAAIGLLLVVLDIFWFGSVYLAAAAAVSIAIFQDAPLRSRLLAASVVLGLFLAAHGIQTACLNHLAGTTFAEDQFVREVSWKRAMSKIPRALEPVFVVPDAFDTAPGQWMVAHVPLFGLGLSLLAYVSCFALPVACADAFRRRLLDRAKRNWVLIALGHYALLVSLLVYLGVRYGIVDKPGQTYLQESSRYAHHILPALAIAWLLPLAGWIAWGWGSQRPGPRAGAAAVALLLGLILASVAYRGVKNAAVAALAPPATPDTAGRFVIEDIDRHPDRRHVVFDPYAAPYLVDGRVHQSFPNTVEHYRRTASRATVYAYVVVRGDRAYPADWMPSAAGRRQIRRYALALASGLHLARIGAFDNGALEVYGGDVPPFSRGRLSQILAAAGTGND